MISNTVPTSAETITSINPADKSLLGEVPCFDRKQVEDAVNSSWTAFKQWKETEFSERRQLLHKLHELIFNQKENIAHLISTEVGKPLFESMMAEMTGVLEACTWFADNAEKSLQDQAVAMTNPLLSSKQSIIVFEPLGVIGIIAPWNYPFAIPMMSIIMAVATGNTVVLKPSEKCPLIGIKIGELFLQAGFPPGVVTVITGGRQTGAYLTESKLSKIFFTGSTIGGSKVMEQAAKNLIPVSLELGGKDAAIVLDDAPIEWTAQGIVWGAFTNCGQACASTERVYIVKGKNTQLLIDAIVKLTSELRVGPGVDAGVEVGPLIDEEQLAKVESQVEAAKAAGAKVLYGGKRLDELGGYFYAPTVMANVDHAMEVMADETFGPVLPIMVVDSIEEAVKLANDSEFGLSASVWTKNLGLAEDIANDLEVGTVFINDGLFSFACPQLPWGGLKKSGFGRVHSLFGLMDLVNIKHITIDTAGGARRLWWYPYGKSRLEVARGGIGFLHGSFPLGKIAGLSQFLSNFFGGK